ncbi:hypothetical protein DRJ24_02865 [Candidatus Acetothermia bacterium]|nr:MAG: hypothetical protein DRJ24_02865 [Candidatus Acetothermia bacterium]
MGKGSIYGRFRGLPIAEAALVSAIWASSFVGVKVALAYAGPFTIAALRYSIAALLLLPALIPSRSRGGRGMGRIWPRLLGIGLAQYLIGNGALFFALTMVTPTEASLALCLTPIPVLALEFFYLKERTGLLHLLGIAIAMGGTVLFFSFGLQPVPAPAIGMLALATISFAFLPVFGREIARTGAVSNTVLTGVPLAIGGGGLLLVALVVEGIPRLPPTGWGIVLGLAVVNTLAAYLLFNHALRSLKAGEANILLNLSPIGTALIAWGALGDRLTPFQMAAMAIAVIGVSLAQSRRIRPPYPIE